MNKRNLYIITLPIAFAILISFVYASFGISLVSPSDNIFLNYNTSVDFVFNVTGNYSYYNCSLYTNKTGTFEINSTNSTVLNNTLTILTLFDFSEGAFVWNVYCVNDSEVNWSSSNYTFTVDTVSPQLSGNATYPASPATYSPGQSYQFNVTWTELNPLTVKIEHNFTGDFANNTMSNSSAVYYYDYTSGVAVGTYLWRAHANDSAGNTNTTTYFSFEVQKASSSINLTLDNNATNTTVEVLDYVALNITLLSGEGVVDLLFNGSWVNSSYNLSHSVRATSVGYINVTAIYNETQNYSSSINVYYINITDTTPPAITVNSPQNDTSFSSSNFTLDITTGESATCDFSTDGSAYNSSFTASQTTHVLTVVLSDGHYNISINCTDSYGNTNYGNVTNITIDTTTPSLAIVYPSDYQQISGLSVQLNYTYNESSPGQAWFLKDMNSTKNYTVPTDTTGGINSITISFLRPGFHTIALYANDSSGSIVNSNVSFILNASFNATQWGVDFNSSLGEADSVAMINSSGQPIESNLTMDQEVTMELNFSDISVTVYNFTALNASWDSYFSAEEDDSDFESDVATSLGTNVTDYVHISNFTRFYNATNGYFGRVRLPRNSTGYTRIYYCPDDELSNCVPITTCSGGYSKSSSSACYNSTTDYTYVYVPHFSAVFGDNDTIAPTINITSPVAGSTLNTSSDNTLSFTTNENTTCVFSKDGGAYSSTYSVSSGPRTYSTTFYVSANGAHNITINCTDSSSLLTQEVVNFTVADTIYPRFVSGPSATATTSSITVSFTASESVNMDIRIIGESEYTTSSTYQTSHTGQVSGLDSDTSYTYNVTVCDRIGNCNSTTGTKSTSAEDDDTGTGSSSSSSSTTGGTTATSTTKYSQFWPTLPVGKHTMSISSTKISFTQIVFRNSRDIATPVDMIVQVISQPSELSKLKDEVFQYIKVDKTELTDSDVTDVTIKFRVDKTWLDANNIDEDNLALYRYSGYWIKMSTDKKSSDSSYVYYEADCPGLSYFGISGTEKQETDTQSDSADTTPTGNAVTEVSDTQAQSTEQDTGVTENKKSFSWVLFPLILLGLIIAGAGGFLFYQRSISVLQDSQLREVRQYVEKCEAQGVELASIKDSLLKSGWSESIVDIVMHDVHIPNQELTKISAYITNMQKLGKGIDEIKTNLRKVGWQPEVIQQAFTLNKINAVDKKEMKFSKPSSVPLVDKQELNEVIDYIKKLKEFGQPDSKVRQKLKKAGWSETIIKEAFNSIK
ncbi:PGF-pre-PGF domain-containing protein [Candidatus Woesearchaeota archaeon]|nr:PGF-pre-PGF domain-containing protein [Candidatus Woesearchaeota archaeon]